MASARPTGNTRLSRETIVAAAARLIEEEGLEGLTMRRLAARCGSKPMSLYRHVATKEDVVRAVVERELGDVALPDTEGLSWRDAIIRVVVHLHGAFLEHPRLPEVLALQHADALAVHRGTEVVLRSLRTAGLDDEDAARTLAAIVALGTGFVQRAAEVRRHADAAGGRLERLRGLSEEEFPHLVGLADVIVAADAEADLEDALGLLLDGVERRLERRAG